MARQQEVCRAEPTRQTQYTSTVSLATTRGGVKQRDTNRSHNNDDC